MAGRCTGYGSETGESLTAVIAGIIGAECGIWQSDFGADGAYPAGISIDDTASDRNASGKTELVGCFLT